MDVQVHKSWENVLSIGIQYLDARRRAQIAADGGDLAVLYQDVGRTIYTSRVYHATVADEKTRVTGAHLPPDSR